MIMLLARRNILVDSVDNDAVDTVGTDWLMPTHPRWNAQWKSCVWLYRRSTGARETPKYDSVLYYNINLGRNNCYDQHPSCILLVSSPRTRYIMGTRICTNLYYYRFYPITYVFTHVYDIIMMWTIVVHDSPLWI